MIFVLIYQTIDTKKLPSLKQIGIVCIIIGATIMVVDIILNLYTENHEGV